MTKLQRWLTFMELYGYIIIFFLIIDFCFKVPVSLISPVIWLMGAIFYWIYVGITHGQNSK